jgi:predicted CXXCH cytochrome family protein
VTPRRAGFALLLALALVLPVRAADGPVLLYPPDLLLSAEEKVKLFAWNPGKGGVDNILLNGVSSNPWEGEGFLKAEAALVPGLNVLQAFGGTFRLFVLPGAKLEQFRLATGQGGEESLLFQAYRLHPALDDGCEGCHAVEGGKLKAKDQKEACYACHNDFSKAEDGKKVFLHDPVAKGECTGCHDPHFSARPKLRKLEKGCLECHDPFPAKGTVHQPVANNDCVSCHSPHAGPAPKQLVRPGNALCLGCHDTVHERHRTTEVRGKMTEVPEDFPREKGWLACLGCHLPHQSAERKLFRMNQQDLCKACHRL